MAMQCIRSSPQQHVTSYILQVTTRSFNKDQQSGVVFDPAARISNISSMWLFQPFALLTENNGLDHHRIIYLLVYRTSTFSQARSNNVTSAVALSNAPPSVDNNLTGFWSKVGTQSATPQHPCRILGRCIPSCASGYKN